MQTILFFGELPPKTIHGVSFSNEINLEILTKYLEVKKIVESTAIQSHQRFTIRKLLQLLKYGFSVLKLRLKSGKSDFFYLPFSISFQGAIKVLYLIVIFRLLNMKAKIILHIYRSDLPIFYAKSWINRIIVSLILKIANTVVILSESMISIEMQLKFPVFKVVPNTVKCKLNHFPAQRNNNLLYISHYIKSKGIFDLLDAMKRIGNNAEIKLNCYGQFTNNEEKKNILNYKDINIEINSFIEENDKLYKIAEAACLILPSHNEGQPQVIFEAMSVGTPVIATNVGDIKNILGATYPFLVKPHSITEIEEAILRFYQLSEMERNKISAYLKDRFESHFSMEIHTKKILEVFGQPYY